MARTAAEFVTIRSESGLVPPDLIARIAAGDRELGHLDAASYGIEGRLQEQIAGAWARVRGYWSAFQASRRTLGKTESGVTETREQWVLPLLRELGYRRPEFRAAAETVGGRSYLISHRAEGVPIHIVGFRQELDRGQPAGAGMRLSPHAMMQEYLNATPPLYGIVSNGLRLRLLRQHASLTRLAYLEFDLETMLEAGVYSDFVLLFLLLHRTRLPRPGESACPLELWRDKAETQGTRALGELRKGVEQAIVILGSGLLAHPGNETLRAQLRSGALSAQDYYQQLLRLIYRLLFLLVAEERDLLFDEHADPRERARYTAHYAVSRLRDLVRKARTDHRHDDLWRTLLLVFDLLGGRQIEGLPARPASAPPLLGLRPLGGLFDPDSARALDGALLSNADLAEAILHLSVVRVGKVTRRVNYRDLDIEELGGVYESLLERTPRIAVEGGAVRFELAPSLARKQSGSYYTPRSLVQALISSALEPVLAERLAGLTTVQEREQAILSLTVCDPACGSGHFLLAAARRLARELALVRAGNRELAPAELRAAVREVIRSCIYGVDVNPLAVDLCKLALWIESHQPGKPISFLDAHIRCGNSLIGTTPALMARGIPDGAYDPVIGDDKEVAKRVKRRNRDERAARERAAGGLQLDLGMRPQETSDAEVERRLRDLVRKPEERLEDVAALAEEYAALRNSPTWQEQRTLADLWTAAFFTPLTPENDRPLSPTDPQTRIPTTRTLLRAAIRVLDGRMSAEAAATAATHRFFHWPLEFPEVFAQGGFDVVLGNPPWERIKLQEEEFFKGRSDAIANALNSAARQRLIADLPKTDPALAAAFTHAKRAAEAMSRFLRASGRFPLTAVGDINHYSVFAEQFRALLNRRGRAGLVCPTGIATDDTTKQFFDALGRDRALASLFDFENSSPIFSGVHRSYKFCLLTLSRAPVERGAFAFFLTDPAQLADPARIFTLAPEDFRLLNPNTGTCPVFRTRADAELTRAIYRRVPVLVNEQTAENPWGVSFLAMFHMANDSGLFRTAPGPGLVPLYEAKLFHQFTHRWATYDGKDTRELTPTELADPSVRVQPRYWVPKREVEARLAGRWDRQWLLGWRDVCRSTDERTTIFAVVPRVGVGHTAPLVSIQPAKGSYGALLMANMNSLILDLVARQKVGGTHLSYGFIKQFPILPPSAYRERDLAFIVPRVLELVYTAWDLQPFARDLGYHGPPFRWDEERRALLRAELDAYFARLYGLTRKQVRYILDPHDLTDRELADILDPSEDPPDAPRTTTFPGETFRVLKQNELRLFGEYRTKRLVLEAWDRLEHMAVGAPVTETANRQGAPGN